MDVSREYDKHSTISILTVVVVVVVVVFYILWKHNIKETPGMREHTPLCPLRARVTQCINTHKQWRRVMKKLGAWGAAPRSPPPDINVEPTLEANSITFFANTKNNNTEMSL